MLLQVGEAVHGRGLRGGVAFLSLAVGRVLGYCGYCCKRSRGGTRVRGGILSPGCSVGIMLAHNPTDPFKDKPEIEAQWVASRALLRQLGRPFGRVS